MRHRYGERQTQTPSCRSAYDSAHAPVVQWIEWKIPVLQIRVRFPTGVLIEAVYFLFRLVVIIPSFLLSSFHTIAHSGKVCRNFCAFSTTDLSNGWFYILKRLVLQGRSTRFTTQKGWFCQVNCNRLATSSLQSQVWPSATL